MPDHGAPHHQLALLAVYERDLFRAAFHFLHCMRARTAATVAKENLDKLLRQLAAAVQLLPEPLDLDGAGAMLAFFALALELPEHSEDLATLKPRLSTALASSVATLGVRSNPRDAQTLLQYTGLLLATQSYRDARAGDLSASPLLAFLTALLRAIPDAPLVDATVTRDLLLSAVKPLTDWLQVAGMDGLAQSRSPDEAALCTAAVRVLNVLCWVLAPLLVLPFNPQVGDDDMRRREGRRRAVLETAGTWLNS